MHYLVCFSFSNTQFPLLPPQGKCAVVRLYLANNRLRAIDPSSLSSGESSLVELDLQGNRLSGLPDDIGRLQKLKLLNAANNDLSDIPYTIGYIAALQRFVIISFCYLQK